MTVSGQVATEGAGSGGSALSRFLFVHQIDEYPRTGGRLKYLAVAILATIVLYYTYYTQTGVTPNILRTFHMSFKYYVWIVIISNLLGAFASLPASKTDRLGRSNVIIYGLLIIGLLVTFGVTNVHTELGFAIVISAIGLVEGAILVATPAMVRDYSPQLGRASAMGFWTIGPVAGSLITSIVANRTLSHFAGWGTQDWHSQFYFSGITALVVFVISLVLMKDLSAKLRDQLMVSERDRTLIEARARGISEKDVEAATSHPWRQIAKVDLVLSSLGIALFLLIYYAAASFFTIYYAVTFQNSNGVNYSTSQVNGLNTWFWTADIIALIVIGVCSDRARVRKPFMFVGTIGAIVSLFVFRSYASTAHTGYYTLALTSAVLAVFLSMVFAPWMAGYTETVEEKNPALVGTGLALWGWILRLVVGISFIFLPIVITSVNPVVDNQPYALHEIDGVPMQTFVAEHPTNVAYAKAHRSFLRVLNEPQVTPAVSALSAPGGETPANIAAVQKVLTPAQFAELVKTATTLKKYVVPYAAQLAYLTVHYTQFTALTHGVKHSPSQWQRWFLIDIFGMVLFFPTIWLTRGRWSPRQARLDEVEHSHAVDAELAELFAQGDQEARVQV